MTGIVDKLCLFVNPRSGEAASSSSSSLSNMTSASGTSGSLHGTSLHIQAVPGFHSSSLQTSSPFPVSSNNKRKRRPAGTPDPDAEVVALSPKTLMESDRYVCEICNQGFQRDQNLQMHRRRHKVPWKLLKRPTPEVRKRVYVCPDPTCLHNDPCHALGDLVGIKKHFRRKHSIEKQWKCEKCSKGYAVQSDYKAHLKTCGTRGHSCDCGRVFSRVESFIEHQDNCIKAKERAAFGYSDQPSLPSLTARTSSSNDTLSATRSELSSAGKQFDSAKFHDQAAWPNMEQRELQFLPANHQYNTSETAITSTNNAADVTRDHFISSATDQRSNPATSHAKEHRFLDDSALRLQLSLGFCTDPPENHEKKPHVKSDHFAAANQRQPSNRAGSQRALGLALNSNDSMPGTKNVEAEAAMTDVFSTSSRPVDHYEASLINDTGSSGAVVENGFRDSPYKRRKELSLFEALWPGHMVRRDSEEVQAPVNLTWKSSTAQIPAPPLPETRQGEKQSRYLGRMAEAIVNVESINSQSEAVERTQLVNPWSDIAAAARLAKEQAQQERDEAKSHMAGVELLKHQAREQLRQATAEKAYAEHARDLAKKQIELAEAEFAAARRIQEQAQAQLAKAQLLKEQATRRIDETRLEITCQACRQQFLCHIPPSWQPDQNSNKIPMMLPVEYPSASNFSRPVLFQNGLKKEP